MKPNIPGLLGTIYDVVIVEEWVTICPLCGKTGLEARMYDNDKLDAIYTLEETNGEIHTCGGIQYHEMIKEALDEEPQIHYYEYHQ